jgi:hypothetical protein
VHGDERKADAQPYPVLGDAQHRCTEQPQAAADEVAAQDAAGSGKWSCEHSGSLALEQQPYLPATVACSVAVGSAVTQEGRVWVLPCNDEPKASHRQSDEPPDSNKSIHRSIGPAMQQKQDPQISEHTAASWHNAMVAL